MDDEKLTALEITIFRLGMEKARLQQVIQKAIHDIDMAGYGEGYCFNLHYLAHDLRQSLREDYTNA